MKHVIPLAFAVAFGATACGSRTGIEGLGPGFVFDAGEPSEAGRDADAGCLPGGEVVLARGDRLSGDEARYASIAIDDRAVYWPVTSSGSVLAVSKCGGVVTTLASSQRRPWRIAVDETSVYWTVSDAASGALVRAPKRGGTPTTLTSAPTLGGRPVGIPFAFAIDDTAIYWLDPGGIGSGGSDTSSLFRMPKAGGDTVTLLKLSFCGFFAGLALDSTNAYYAESSCDLESGLARVPKVGGMPHAVTSGPLGYNVFVSDGANVFLAAGLGIARVPVGGGRPAPLAASTDDVRGIAVDGSDVFFTDGAKVSRVPKVGGPEVAVASGQRAASGIAVDASRAYWRNADGEVVTAPK